MKKILFITPVTFDSCSFYRTGGISPDLMQKLGIEITVTSLDRERFDWQKLLEYSLVMFQRPYSETTLNMGIYVRNLGIPLWVDFDDYILDVPVGNPAYDTLFPASETIIKLAAIADVVTTSTELLKKAFTPFNQNITVIPNAFNDYLYKKRNNLAPRQKLILWRGSNSHIPDLMRYEHALNLMLSGFPEWTFAFMGTMPWFLEQAPNMKYIPVMDPIFYFQAITSLASPAIHVPLVDSLFNRCKSNIAFIEGAYCGSVCIAPDWDEWKKPGVLNYTDDASYFELIEAVTEGGVDIKAQTDLSWEYITDNLMLSKVNEMRVDLVRKLLNL